MASASSDYDRLRAQLEDDASGLTDQQALEIARRLTLLEPERVHSWWALANVLDWTLRECEGADLRTDRLFSEMLHAYDRVIELDDTDAAGPYNKARNLKRAGLLEDAYEAFMLAGKTEAAHPNLQVEWPAWWHFESAAEVALELDNSQAALVAAQAAIDVGEVDEADAQSLLRRLVQGENV